MKHKLRAGLAQVMSGQAIGLYRAELMGMAILWIMAFHCYLKPLEAHRIPIVYAIIKHGNLGVEIFLFLSGIGLYHSQRRKSGITAFYLRRVIRVVLPWLILSFPYWGLKTLIIDRGGFGAFLLNWSGLSFWTDGITTVWYVAFSVLLYALYPLIFRCQRRSAATIPALIAGAILLNIVLYLICPAHYDKIEIALARIPVFLLGCYAGESIAEEKKLFKNRAVYLYLLVMILLYVFKLCYNRFDLPWPTLSVAVLIGRLGGQATALLVILAASLLFTVFGLKPLKKMLSFLGGITLELYLLHVFLLNIASRSGILNGAGQGRYYAVATAVIFCSIIGGLIFSRIYGYILQRLELRRRSGAQ